MSWVLIALIAWVVGFLIVWALVVAAGRADERRRPPGAGPEWLGGWFGEGEEAPRGARVIDLAAEEVAGGEGEAPGAEAAAAAGEAAAPGAEPIGPPGAPGERRAEPEPEPALVVDISLLRGRLSAAATLLESQRVAVTVTGPHAERDVASVESGERPTRRHEARATIGERAVLVASRDARDRPFMDVDLRLLAALADSLREVLAIPEQPPPRGRFARRGRGAESGTPRRP